MAQVNARERAAERQASRSPLERSRTDRMAAGVAGGIGRHLGVDSNIVRAGFIGLSFAFGFGVVVYLLTWLLARLETLPAATDPQPRKIRTPTRSQMVGVGLVAGGLVILLWISGLWFGGDLGWPVVLAAIGFAILWARSTDGGRSRWTLSSLGTPLESVVSGEVSLPRMAIGSLLILAGMAVFLAANTSLAAAGNMLLAMIVAIGGGALLAGPWVWGMGRALVEERGSRIRSEARAEMAAHLHDSVLQTLALIQRAKAPREMASLARTQERELRAWLYGRAPALAGVRLRDAIDSMAGRIERQHQVTVEAVVVGDAELDDRLRAPVATADRSGQPIPTGRTSRYPTAERDEPHLAVQRYLHSVSRPWFTELVPDDDDFARQFDASRLWPPWRGTGSTAPLGLMPGSTSDDCAGSVGISRMQRSTCSTNQAESLRRSGCYERSTVRRTTCRPRSTAFKLRPARCLPSLSCDGRQSATGSSSSAPCQAIRGDHRRRGRTMAGRGAARLPRTPRRISSSAKRYR